MFFKKKTLSFDQTGLFSDLICDFSHHHSDLKPFLQRFPSLNSIKSSLSCINNDSKIMLVDVLNKQYEKTQFFNTNLSHVKKNIKKLLKPKSYTITTGHQLHLFMSPLFLIYKIISTISYANYLNQNIPTYDCVPCFWMATEDHDFNEINYLKLYNKTYTWNLKHKDAVGNLCSKSILPILQKIKKILNHTEFGKELYQIYNFAYSKNRNYADATRSLLTTLFNKYGLVVVDGNHPDFKKSFINDFVLEINKNNIFNNISKTNNLMSQKYAPKINPLKSNIFYLFNSIRSKIQFNGSKYYSIEHEKTWSKSEFLNEVNLHPERFSPNVFLRTLYQECIMPNIMYIGGPSEISYWLQLKKVFQTVNREYPVLALRSCFLLLSKKDAEFKRKHKLTNQDLFQDVNVIIKKILKSLSGLKSDMFIDEMNLFLSKIEKKIKNKNNSSITSFFVFETRLKKELLRLESKIIKSQKIKNQDILNELMLVNQKLFPNNLPQERVNSFIPYYTKYGKNFFDLLIQESSIFDDKYIILTEDQ